MTFLSPWWLLLLVPIALMAAAYVVQQSRRSKYAVRFASLPMLERLIPRRPGWRRHLPAIASLFGFVLLAFAVARPEMEVRVLMTVGRKVDPTTLGAVPSNAHVQQWCPQAAVLAHAAAMIGHGGFGTTMGALAAGVPQVVAPIFTFDQVVNGEHVASVGAGLTVEVGPGAVERAVTQIPRLLEVPDYTTAARRIAIAMRDLPPPADAVPRLVGLAS